MSRRSPFGALPLVALLAAGAGPDIAAQSRPFPPPIAIQVFHRPAPLPAGPTRYLCYELHLTSYGADTARIVRVEVFEAPIGNGTPLLVYGGNELAAVTARPGVGLRGLERAPPTDVIGPGSHAMVYVWVPLPAAGPAPARLVNRVTFELGPNGNRYEDAVNAEVSVEPATTVVRIGAPLKGGPWAVFNGPSNTSGHRRTPLVFDGRPALAQRYAIDFVKLTPAGGSYATDSTRNENYPSYGQEVIAVADAMVATVFDGVKENIARTTFRPDPFTIRTAIGNHVILDLGQGRFALYAHLQPGSLRVRVGQRVRRGEILGLLGNAGNSFLPHLHFHIVDRNLALGAEGLPYVIDGFDLLGTCEPVAADAIGRIPEQCTIGTATRRTGSIPLRDQVVRFGPGSR